MRIAYESTIDEAVEAQFRVAEQLGLVKKLKWIGLLACPLFFVIVFLPLGNLTSKLILSSIAVGLFIFYHLSTYKKRYRKQLQKASVKGLGAEQPIPSEYEVNEEQLTFRRLGTEIRFSWDNVKEIKCTEESIEVIMKPTGIAIIPKRIFSSSQELEEWTAFIEKHSGPKQ